MKLFKTNNKEVFKVCQQYFVRFWCVLLFIWA